MNNFSFQKYAALVHDFKNLVKQNLKLINENEKLLFKSDKDDIIIKKLQKENEQLRRLLLREVRENKENKENNRIKEVTEVPTKSKITSINIYC